MSLCIDCACAFCCDGTLYSRAPLKDEDLSLLPGRFDVLQADTNDEQDNKEAHFRLPCQLCVDERCSIHEERRPAICGDYQCKLVVRHASGEVTVEQARELVENVKRLRDRLRPKLETITGAEGGTSFVELTLLAASRLEMEGATQRTPESAQTLLDIGMMRILLAKNFDSRLTKHTYLADKALLAMEGSTEAPVEPEAVSGNQAPA